jgi:hypothetical protein
MTIRQMIEPPGMRAATLGVNAIGTCKCGNQEFNLLVAKSLLDGDVLVATHCTHCHMEQPVPIGPNDQYVKGRKFIT